MRDQGQDGIVESSRQARGCVGAHLSLLVALLVGEQRPDVAQYMARKLMGLVGGRGIWRARMRLAHARSACAEAQAAWAPARGIPPPLLVGCHVLDVAHQLAAPDQYPPRMSRACLA